jgi:VIT1/CCC1 family predicted Fe2+/Mn2+ transporter
MNKSHTHTEHHLRSSAFIQDVVIGMSDGLTVPFALAAGLSSAVADNHLITTAGIAEIIAGSIAMGLGGYLSGRTELDHYRSEKRKEYEEVERIPGKEKAEIKEIFAGYGLSAASQEVVAAELSKDKDKWVDFMMKYELGLDKPDEKRAGKSAATIGISYLAGGSIPLIPYFITEAPLRGLEISAVVTLVCLFVFGYFKSSLTGQPVWSGALKVMVIGAIAAGAAFYVARLFGSHI